MTTEFVPADAVRWAAALTELRSPAYLLTAPVFVWRGLVRERRGELAELTPAMIESVRRALSAVADDRAAASDPFDGFPR